MANELEDLVATLHEELLTVYTERLNLLAEIRRLRARLADQDADTVEPDVRKDAP